MKKILIYLAFLSLTAQAQDSNKHYVKTTTYDLSSFSNEAPGITNYTNFDVSITPAEMYTCPSGYTTTAVYGGATVNITNNQLTVNITTSGADPCKLKLGVIKILNTTPQLPDIDLGPLIVGGTPSTSFYAIIKGGNLCFYSRHYLTGVDGTLTANFIGSAVNYGPVGVTSPYICTPSCSCGGNGSTIKITGNTIELYLNSGWASTCNIKTGAIMTLPVTIPDTELGIIKTMGHDTAYKAKIVSNVLYFYTNETPPSSLPSQVNIATYPYPFTLCLSQNQNNLISGETVTYYDELEIPTLTLNYDRATSRIWASEYAYDNYNRLTKESYESPLPACEDYGYTGLLSSPSSSLYNYYSDSNVEEPYQATATQPYNQFNYDKLNPGNIINITGGNMIGGQWKTGYTFTVPAAQEMYYLYGKDYFNGPVAGGNEEVITKFFKTTVIDVNGIENVLFSDAEGNVLSSARSGSGPQVPVLSLIGTQGFVDVYIPSGIPSNQIVLLNGASNYTIYNLKTGVIDTNPLSGGNAYRIVANTIPSQDPKVYITSAGGITYNTADTTIRGISYKVNYYDYSLNIYNNTGQLVKSVQPKGTQLNTTVVAVPSHMNPAATDFISTYKYNTLGQLTAVSNPDEGSENFSYRKDGQIRYAQNAQQLLEGKIAYVDYDSDARPIASGIIESTASFNSLNPDAALITGTRTEQTFSVYDYEANIPSGQIAPPALSSLITATGYVQNNLAGNVALTYGSVNGTSVSSATWYSYDIYGRTEWIVKWTPELGAKPINYRYDLKGNVKNVFYNLTSSTDFYGHIYTYNNASQLVKVETGTGGYYSVQAEYSYYLSGELKRTEYAGGVQGVDYVYTLDGKLKSINNANLNTDPGGDTNDLFGMTLDYFNGDYSKAGTNISTSASLGGYNTDQYNGNIKAIRFANRSLDVSGSTVQPKAQLFNYNRNNWLSNAYYGTVNTNNTISITSNYKENGISYDANGNITFLQRTNETATVYDNFVYNYTAGKNRLDRVNDIAGATASITYDIEPQAAGNYTYNAIGQMTYDASENLYYYYNSAGLVTEVRKGPTNAVVKFFYDENGQRIKKEVYNTASPYTLQATDYYVRDASGTIMTVYGKIGPSGTIGKKETPLYGLNRIGVNYSYFNGTLPTTRYEITDHLGNVRAVFTKSSSTTAAMDSYADYYPFGEKLPGRNAYTAYRYSFQGQELDQQTGMEAFELRLWEGRLGRWLSPDPVHQYPSAYMGMGNNPVSGIDPDGGYVYILNRDGSLTLALNAVLHTTLGLEGVGKFIDDPNNHLIIVDVDLVAEEEGAPEGGHVYGSTQGPFIVTGATTIGDDTKLNLANNMKKKYIEHGTPDGGQKDVDNIVSHLNYFNGAVLQPGNNYLIAIDVKECMLIDEFKVVEGVFHEPYAHANDSYEGQQKQHFTLNRTPNGTYMRGTYNTGGGRIYHKNMFTPLGKFYTQLGAKPFDFSGFTMPELDLIKFANETDNKIEYIKK